MHLVPFRVAGMDQSVKYWDLNVENAPNWPDGIPGEEVSRWEYDAYLKVEKSSYDAMWNLFAFSPIEQHCISVGQRLHLFAKL